MSLSLSRRARSRSYGHATTAARARARILLAARGIGDDDDVSADRIAADMLRADSDARGAFVAFAQRVRCFRDAAFAGVRSGRDAGALGQDRGIAKERASRRSLGDFRFHGLPF